jgi:hypothetical protein
MRRLPHLLAALEQDKAVGELVADEGETQRIRALGARVPEAVCAYEQACTVLRKKLDIPPGPTLARLQTRVVEGESLAGGK